MWEINQRVSAALQWKDYPDSFHFYFFCFRAFDRTRQRKGYERERKLSDQQGVKKGLRRVKRSAEKGHTEKRAGKTVEKINFEKNVYVRLVLTW